MPEIKAEFPIGKTQWAKWGPEAREAFNKCGRLGYKLITAVDEANAVQAKVRAKALDELIAEDAELIAPPQAKTVTPTPKKTTAPKRKAK